MGRLNDDASCQNLCSLLRLQLCRASHRGAVVSKFASRPAALRRMPLVPILCPAWKQPLQAVREEGGSQCVRCACKVPASAVFSATGCRNITQGAALRFSPLICRALSKCL